MKFSICPLNTFLESTHCKISICIVLSKLLLGDADDKTLEKESLPTIVDTVPGSLFCSFKALLSSIIFPVSLMSLSISEVVTLSCKSF